MPEGDTIHNAAARLRPALEGRRLVAVEGSHPAVRREGRRLSGATVAGVAAVGKHLLIHTDRAWTLRTHLGMTGHWHLYDHDEPWRRTAGKARVVLRTDSAVAVCFAAPTVEIGPTDRILRDLLRVGPDLIDPDVNLDEILQRARASQAPTMADLLLDQGLASGIGNVFKSEVLFMERIDPAARPAQVPDARLRDVYLRAAKLLRVNVGGAPRTTTGRRGRESTWVYGRGGRPCRRCGTVIRSATHGPLARVTYWCPSCQASSPAMP